MAVVPSEGLVPLLREGSTDRKTPGECSSNASSLTCSCNVMLSAIHFTSMWVCVSARRAAARVLPDILPGPAGGNEELAVVGGISEHDDGACN